MLTIITGANRGIGLALTKAFLKADHQVIATARQVSDELRALAADKRLQIAELEVTDLTSVERFANELSGKPVDVLINNAGLFGNRAGLKDTTKEDLLKVYEVNAIGPLLVTSALYANLKLAKGKVFHVSSGLGSIGDGPNGGAYAYRMSKSALQMFAANFAAEAKSDGIASIAVEPGWVRTDMGGAGAPLAVEDSVALLMELFLNKGFESTGKFFSLRGKEMPW